ncbi:MAG: hypothetical protein AAF485_10515 [Chloroflexota bacterium]
MTRKLTETENNIFTLITTIYGDNSKLSDIDFIEGGIEAIISIKDETGEAVMFANITNLAEWRMSGVIESDEDLINNWLKR